MYYSIVFVFILFRLISASSGGPYIARGLDKSQVASTTGVTTGDAHLTTVSSQSPTHRAQLQATTISSTIKHARKKTPTTTVIPASRILPTSTPTNSIVHMDLTSSVVNKNISNLEVDGHKIPVTCLNCSTTGKLEVTGHDLRWDGKLSDDNHEQGLGFKEGRFRAHLPYGLAGHIELGLESASSLTRTFNLTELPLVGFFLPHAGVAGVSLDIGIPVSLQLESKADVSFGFTFSVPQGSYIDIDVADLQNSSVKGFTRSEGLDFQLLPLNVSVPGQDVKLSAALQFDLTFGAELLDNRKVAEFGAQLQLPRVYVEERQVHNVDGKCSPLKQNTTTQSDTVGPSKTTTGVKATNTSQNVARHLIGNYTNIIPSFGMNFDVFGGVGLKDAVGKEVEISMSTRSDIQVLKTAWELSTACISNRHSATTSTSTTSSATTSVTSKSTTSNAGSSPTHKGVGTRQGLRQGSAAMPFFVALGWLVCAF